MADDKRTRSSVLAYDKRKREAVEGRELFQNRIRLIFGSPTHSVTSTAVPWKTYILHIALVDVCTDILL